MKLKIAIVISDLEFGGAQRQVVELANNVNRDMFELHICSLSENNSLAINLNENIPFHILRKKSKYDLSVSFRLAKLIYENRIDIVHGYLFDADVAARMAKMILFCKIKTIGSERSVNYLVKPIRRLTQKLTGSLVDAMIANSTEGANFSAALTGIPRNKYSVIYNGVDTTKFSPKKSGVSRQNLNLNLSDPIVGIFASFKVAKNHAFLLHSVKGLIHKYPDLKILFVGDRLLNGLHGSDEYYKSLMNLVTELELENNCIFLGSRMDVEDIYPACDFTVLPSIYEGTPNTILESMACGIPVIATNVSDNRYIISEGITGYLVEIDDIDNMTRLIDLMLSEKEKTKTMGRESRKKMLEKYSSIELARNTESVYESLM